LAAAKDEFVFIST